YSDLMRRPVAPVPQDEILVAAGRAGSEARNKDTSDPSRNQPPRELPACRLSSLPHVQRPSAGKVRKHRAVLATSGIGTQVCDVGAVDLVTAQNTGIELERIFAGGLLDGGFDAERKIERRHTFRIKSAAVDSGTIPGERLERPLGMVRPVTGRL